MADKNKPKPDPGKKDPEGAGSKGKGMTDQERRDNLDVVVRDFLGVEQKKTDDPEGSDS